MNTLLNCQGRILDLTQPVVMGILNVTPDSFFDGGKFNDENNIRMHVEKMLTDGASIIDIGAASSRPGAAPLSAEDEWMRLKPILKLLTKQFPDAFLSIDTFHSEVAGRSIDSGAKMINDITAGGTDDRMLKLLSGKNVPYIMMHMQGTPQTMQIDPQYENVSLEVIRFFVKKIENAFNHGIKDTIIDPGFGFGKTLAHNFSLLNDLSHFKVLNRPILVGLSRKSIINATLKIKAQEALNGTTVLNTIALLKGASILRVHDVKEAVEAIKLFSALNLLNQDHS